MRAIRDNEIAAAAMGKDDVDRRRGLFWGLPSSGLRARCTTLDGQFTPGSCTFGSFLIWVMVIIGEVAITWGSPWSVYHLVCLD